VRRLLPLLVLAAACSKSGDAPKPADVAPPPVALPATPPPVAPTADGPTNPVLEATKFAPSLDVNLKASMKSPSGLYYRDIVVGTGGVATTGSQVAVNYDGALADGTHFESGPYSFPLGMRQVVRGWDEGLVGMKVGGKRQLIVPPDLGYGPAGRPPKIPANSVMIFTVELVHVQ
jgi:FKBP-type peptidyl-prolyl cis-trans isomerase FkpA